MVDVLLEEKNIVPARHGDDVSQYLHEIRQYPMLTPQQERELAMDCAKGDIEAIRTMVNSNLRLVVSIAREYAGRGVPLLDLIQEGSIGLLAAARKFDYTMDCRFSTYATKWIRQGVNRCVLNHGQLIRVPLHTQELIRKVMVAKAALKQHTGEEPEIKDVARETGFSESKILQLLQLQPEVWSLDTPTGEDGDSKLQMLLEDLQASQPQEELVRRELKNTMDTLLDKLTDRQRYVLQMRFGMEDGLCHTLEEIATVLGISKERVRQIEHQGIDKLKKLGNDLGLEDFLD